MSSLFEKKIFHFFKIPLHMVRSEFEIDCKNNHFQKIPCFLCGELQELPVATYKKPVLNIFNTFPFPGYN
jgi:hypothetical protein